MAITIWKPREGTPALAQNFAIDPSLLQTKAAQEARRRGILLAKQQALRAAESLLAWGRLLGWAIIFVSAIHIWESVAAIAPSEVGQLRLPGPIYHLAALGFTLMIDAVALFVSRANAVAALAGAPASRWTIYFYVVTALLNAAFVASHAPALDAASRAAILPRLGVLFVAILPLSVPAGIVAVESSRRSLEVCRLALLAEVATLRELCSPGRATAPPTGGSPQSAAVSVMGASGKTTEPLVGGRALEFSVEDLVSAFAPTDGAEAEIFTPRELRERLGCSESSGGRLLQAACAAGMVEKAARGAYRIR
jgi:hypothetical protein